MEKWREAKIIDFDNDKKVGKCILLGGKINGILI